MSRFAVTDDPCIFCNPDPADVLFENGIWYARADRYPVSYEHLLLIPHRHVASFFDLSPDEQAALFGIVDYARAWLGERYRPDGYNIGVNVGSAAGLAVMQHVVPIGDYRNHRMTSSRAAERADIP